MKDTDRIPNYATKKPKFMCPVSYCVPWHWGLVYKECPVVSEQRNMGVCDDCHLNGRGKKPRKNKEIKIERKKTKSPIPKINKTYVSKGKDE